MEAMDARNSAAPAVDNALRILGFIARQRRPIAAGAIAAQLGLPRSSTYAILTILEEHGYVSHLRGDHKWGLGLSAFELSSGFSQQTPLARLGTPLLATLVDEVGESAHLAVLRGREVVYVVEMRAKHRPPLSTDVGVRLPSDVTASGLAMLSSLPPKQLRAIFSGPESFSNVERGTRTPYFDLKGKLELTRSRGFSIEDEGIAPGLASVAVPVLDHVGWPAAAVAVTFERERIPQEAWPAMAASIRVYADELSRRIGRRADDERRPLPVQPAGQRLVRMLTTEPGTPVD